MKHNVRIALMVATQHEIERMTAQLTEAVTKIETDEFRKEFWKDTAEFWEKELALTQEGYYDLQSMHVDYD
jgi:hypothetical protein